MRPATHLLLVGALGALALYSGWRVVAHTRADAALARGDAEAALAQLPAHPDALATVAERQAAAGDLAAAAITAQALAKAAPLDGRAWRVLAQARAAAGDTDPAHSAALELFLERAAAANPHRALSDADRVELARRIVLVAHSMGSFITMETLRQIAIRGDRGLLDIIDGVVLMSPDIDVDVFRMQARAIGDLPEPFIIFGSDRDSVLRLSSFITGQSEGRLGSLGNLDKLADLDVTYLDVGAFRDGTRHFPAGTSAGLIQIIGRIEDVDVAFGRDRAARTGLLPGVVLTVRRATRIILQPVGAITGTQLN